MSTGLLELIREPGGDGMENLFREVPASHACLVGHDDGGNAALVQAADRLGRAWEEPESLRMVDVPHFLGERSIAVDEHRRPTGHLGSVRRTHR